MRKERELAQPGHGRPGEISGHGPEEVIIRCPAKINLTLEVLGRFPDGYHRIASVMQTVSLADILSISLDRDIIFECDRPGLSGPDNLVVQAAALLKESTDYRGGAHLRLAKKIPEAAGLGGGSSDAAAALRGLNAVWNLRLSRRRLAELAVRLGYDVPFFLVGGTALAGGRGERMRSLPGPGALWLVLVKPPLSLPQKTATLYRALTDSEYTSGRHTSLLAKVLRAGETVSDGMLFNVFEGIARSAFPGFQEYVELLLAAGATAAHLAGSGPTIFAIFSEKAEAQSVLGKLSGIEAYLACTVADGV